MITGAALWAVLPRGVVLTRVLDQEPRLVPNGVLWRITNSSALPVRIRSVTVTSPETHNDATGEIEERLLPHDGAELGIWMTFDDEVLETRRIDAQTPWKGVIVPPGDTLSVDVLNHRGLTIRYRRAGWTGVFERRELIIFGTS